MKKALAAVNARDRSSVVVVVVVVFFVMVKILSLCRDVIVPTDNHYTALNVHVKHVKAWMLTIGYESRIL